MRSLRLLALVALLVAPAGCSSDGSDSPPAVTGADQAGASDDSAAASQKFDLWRQPSYFRGFDVAYYNYEEGTKTQGDFDDLATTGANLAQIQSNEGTRQWAPPYGRNAEGVDGLDAMVRFCRQAELQYVIAVREGPGRQTVDEEARDSIWTNVAEQQRYAEMLRDDIVARYHNDPLMVGINVMVEPNPLNREISDGEIETPADLSRELSDRGIDVNAMMGRFIVAVREADPSLPVIVQCVGWSNPEWWGLLTKQDDPYVVYDFHTYSPYDLTHPDCGQPGCVGAGYPGTIGGERWDRSRIANSLFARVNEFQATHGVPILMGEFGMEYAQPGGAQFLSDHVDIALQRGWHFCLWNFRSDTRDPSVLSFDYEKWDSAYWNEILTWF